MKWEEKQMKKQANKNISRGDKLRANGSTPGLFQCQQVLPTYPVRPFYNIFIFLQFQTFTKSQNNLPKRSSYTVSTRANQKPFFQSRDENENFWHLITGFETRMRKISFSLRHRDKIKIYYFQSQTIIKIKTILAGIFKNVIFCLSLDWYFPKKGC